jgi:ATP-binding cassette, subfamily B, bacterial PglK
MNWFNKVKAILGNRFNALPGLVSLFLIASLLDILSIGLIFPYLDIVMNSKDSDVFLMIAETVLPYINLISIGSNQLLIMASLLIVIMFSMKTAMAIFINKVILNYCYGHGAYLKKRLLKIFQSMDYLNFIKSDSSDYIVAITQLASGFSQSYIQSILRLLSEGLVIILLLAMIGFVNFYILLLLLGLASITFISFNLIASKKMKSYGQIATDTNRNIIQLTAQSIRGFKEIKLFNLQNNFNFRLGSEAEKFATSTVKNQILFTAPRYLIEFLFVLMIVGSVLIFLTAGVKPSTLIPALGLFALAGLRILPSVNVLINSIGQIFYLDYTVDKIFGFISQEDKLIEINENITSLNSKKIDVFKTLKCDGVAFTYPTQSKPTLVNVTFDIKKGEKIGVFGDSGGGKTTFLNLLLGLLEPTEGDIFINGISKNIQNTRSDYFAYLPQEVFLLTDTIKENICLYEDEPDTYLLEAAVANARLDNVISSLDYGIETIIEENGTNLSGGQKQRVAFARAFYLNRNIIILDESTSALDPQNQKEIVDYLMSLNDDITVIFVSHNQEVLNKLDRVYKLSDGKISEIV